MECVGKQLYKLSSSKSGGPDDCHPCVFKEVKEALLQTLFLIYVYKGDDLFTHFDVRT